MKNEYAFPSFYEDNGGSGTGMTLRDYFAAKAMQGICAHNETWRQTLDGIASSAYEMADAMLKAREQK